MVVKICDLPPTRKHRLERLRERVIALMEGFVEEFGIVEKENRTEINVSCFFPRGLIPRGDKAITIEVVADFSKLTQEMSRRLTKELGTMVEDTFPCVPIFCTLFTEIEGVSWTNPLARESMIFC